MYHTSVISTKTLYIGLHVLLEIIQLRNYQIKTCTNLQDRFLVLVLTAIQTPKAHESLNSMVPYRCFKGLSRFPVKILPKLKMFFLEISLQLHGFVAYIYI